MPLALLSKNEVAVSQLNLAMTLYLDGREFVSAITLAGAAEEILGKICEEKGKPSGLKRHAESARSLYLHLGSEFHALFTGDPGTKPFINIRNEARNELKHLISGDPIEVDLEQQAGRLIAHAVGNYRNLFGRETDMMRKFQRKRLNLSEPILCDPEIPI